MEKIFKIFLCIVVSGLCIGVFVVMSIPKPSITIYEESELQKVLYDLNKNLPRTIGTIGTLDSIVYRERTIIYNMTAFGDNRITEVYTQNYNKFKDILKYSILTMNGQYNMGDVFISILEQKKLNIAYCIYTQNGDATEWLISGGELKDFAESCKVSPTTALRTTIDIQIEIANINLPIQIEDINNPIRSVALNAFLGDIDASCLPQSISHIDSDIVFEYDVDEEIIDLNELDNIKNDVIFLDAFAHSLAEDSDVHEFIGMLAISHSNMVIVYNGRNSHRSISIRIPYSILKKYCKVPKNLLS